MISRAQVVRQTEDGKKIVAIPLNWGEDGTQSEEGIILNRFIWDLLNAIGITSQDSEFLSVQLSRDCKGYLLFLREK